MRCGSSVHAVFFQLQAHHGDGYVGLPRGWDERRVLGSGRLFAYERLGGRPIRLIGLADGCVYPLNARLKRIASTLPQSARVLKRQAKRLPMGDMLICLLEGGSKEVRNLVNELV